MLDLGFFIVCLHDAREQKLSSFFIARCAEKKDYLLLRFGIYVPRRLFNA